MFAGRLDGIGLHQSLAAGSAQECWPIAKRSNVPSPTSWTMPRSGCRIPVVREIDISTALVASRDAVEITVADTGHGVTREVKERLFPALFLDQEAWNRAGPGHRQPHCGRSSRLHSRRGESSRGNTVHRRAPGCSGRGCRDGDCATCITFSSSPTNPEFATRWPASSRKRLRRLHGRQRRGLPRSRAQGRLRRGPARYLAAWHRWTGNPGKDSRGSTNRARGRDDFGHGTIETAVRATKLRRLRFSREAAFLEKTLIGRSRTRSSRSRRGHAGLGHPRAPGRGRRRRPRPGRLTPVVW